MHTPADDPNPSPAPRAEPDGLDPLQERAEEVRAYLVALRGGAPFLSPVDARLLSEWLEAGVPTHVILTSLEAAAERRRRRRVRAPLTLASIRGAVRRALRRDHLPSAAGSLDALVDRLRAEGTPEERELAERLAALPGRGRELLRRALAEVRAFHERTWAAADQDALRARAAEEIASLREGMSAPQWERAVEEVARDLARQAHPRVSAAAIIDSLAADGLATGGTG